MEQDREPRDDAREPSSGNETNRAGNVPPRERHDVVETEGSASFWNDVDGMLTGEFTAELLPKDGDYRLGAMPDAFPSSPRDAGLVGADPADFDLADATGPIMNPPTGRQASSSRGAHDGDPNLLGFDAAPTVSSDSIGGATPATPAPPVAHVPLFDPATEVALSKQAGGSSPVSLERSTVVDPVQGPPPGNTFLEGDKTAAERSSASLSAARPTVSLESTAQAAPTIPGAYVASAPPPVYDSRSILLDVVDRQWLTSGLIVLAALSVGVIAWVLLFGSSDDGGGGELIAASTTLPDPAGPSASEDAAAASAGAGTGAFEDPTTASTTVSTTAATEPVTSRQAPRPASPRPTNRPSPGPAPTQSATTPTTSSTNGSPTSDTSDSSSSDPSSSDTTTDTTTDPTGSTDTTIDGTVTTAGTTSVTTSSSTSSSETTASSPPTSDTSSPDNGGGTPPQAP